MTLAIVVVQGSAEAQSIAVSASGNSVSVNGQVVFTITVESDATSPVFGAEAFISFGDGFEIIGGVESGVVLGSEWLAGVERLDNSTLNVAVTAGGEKSACEGPCVVARINGRYTSSGQKDIVIDSFESTWRRPDDARGTEFFSPVIDESVTVAEDMGARFPADTDGDFDIQPAEASAYAAAFVRGDDPGITPTLASRFAAIFVNGGCYVIDDSDFVGFVSALCE